jgi:hypothetical protein
MFVDLAKLSKEVLAAKITPGLHSILKDICMIILIFIGRTYISHTGTMPMTNCSKYTPRPFTPMSEFVYCPECGQPASAGANIMIGSTHGPVEHVRVNCLEGHFFFMPRARLEEM